MAVRYVLRPRITNPSGWYPSRPAKSKWDKIRKIVLDRDNYTCMFCGHKAYKYMNVHHIMESDAHDPENLVTACVACHAVLHIGQNLRLGIIEIWRSKMEQVEIVEHTRAGVASGKTLEEIKDELPISRGKYPPGSIEWANSLVAKIGPYAWAELRKPWCAVFVNLKRWQIE